MNLNTTCISFSILFIFAIGCSIDTTLSNDKGTIINLGDPESEEAHDVVVDDANRVSYKYPDIWVMACRASAYEEGHEPFRAIDGDDDTHWQVVGHPPHPIGGGHWLDLEINRTSKINKISIHWLGDRHYNFKIYNQIFSDQVNIQQIYEGESEGGDLETYHFDDPVKLRSLRIEIAREDKEADGPHGIQEVRLGDLSFPDAYPQAAHPQSQVMQIQRPFYVEFERFIGSWPQFNFRRPVADGGSARRILSRDDFEGGHLDFDISVDPEKQNWITLKMWESDPEVVTEPDNAIALEAFAEDPDQNRRWFLPEIMTETQNLNHEWYGVKPRPGSWVFASYKLSQDITEGKSRVRLRLQGIGNYRRDKPMRSPAPPIYKIYSHVKPFFE